MTVTAQGGEQVRRRGRRSGCPSRAAAAPVVDDAELRVEHDLPDEGHRHHRRHVRQQHGGADQGAAPEGGADHEGGDQAEQDGAGGGADAVDHRGPEGAPEAGEVSTRSKLASVSSPKSPVRRSVASRTRWKASSTVQQDRQGHHRQHHDQGRGDQRQSVARLAPAHRQRPAALPLRRWSPGVPRPVTGRGAGRRRAHFRSALIDSTSFCACRAAAAPSPRSPPSALGTGSSPRIAPTSSPCPCGRAHRPKVSGPGASVAACRRRRRRRAASACRRRPGCCSRRSGTGRVALRCRGGPGPAPPARCRSTL